MEKKTVDKLSPLISILNEDISSGEKPKFFKTSEKETFGSLLENKILSSGRKTLTLSGDISIFCTSSCLKVSIISEKLTSVIFKEEVSNNEKNKETAIKSNNTRKKDLANLFIAMLFYTNIYLKAILGINGFCYSLKMQDSTVN